MVKSWQSVWMKPYFIHWNCFTCTYNKLTLPLSFTYTLWECLFSWKGTDQSQQQHVKPNTSIPLWSDQGILLSHLQIATLSLMPGWFHFRTWKSIVYINVIFPELLLAGKSRSVGSICVHVCVSILPEKWQAGVSKEAAWISLRICTVNPPLS